MSQIYGNGVALTEKVLDYLWQRQTVSLNNIANDDTPGFKSQYISFEEELNKRIKDASKAKHHPKRTVYEAEHHMERVQQTGWEQRGCGPGAG